MRLAVAHSAPGGADHGGEVRKPFAALHHAGSGWSLRGLVGSLADRVERALRGGRLVPSGAGWHLGEWMRTLRIRGCRLSALPLHMARTDPCHIEAPAPGENPGHAVRRR
jgi:hypothetical protein